MRHRFLAACMLAASGMLTGCPEEDARDPSPASSPAAEAIAEPTLEPAPTPPPPPEEKPLDEMSEPELETACFEGRQDACDRLGH